MPSIIERVILPVLLVAGLVALVWAARNRMADSPRFLVDPAQVDVTARPAWLSEPAAHRVAAEVAASLGGPARLLDAEQLQAWRERLAAGSSWVDAVPRVSPRFPYQADVRLVLRRPVLTLSDGRLVTADGVVLHGDPAHVTPRPVPYTGPAVGPRGELDPAVLECAAAMGDLIPWRDELQDLGVDLAGIGVGADDLVVLRTAGGVELEWGRSSLRRHLAAYDIPPRGRLDNLRDVLALRPGLAGVARVELWLDRPKVHPGP